MKIDLIKLQTYIDQKLISKQKHPTEDLWIYNYTQKAQYDHIWNEYTTMARGLILDADGNIVSRCLPKFFNIEEMGPGWKIPSENFEVTNKEDGSLGITYWIGDQPHLATRGSFVSDQALKGTEILHTKYSHVKLNPNYTYLYEIIYPANRIVLDYKGLEDIILLAKIHTETGKEVDCSQYKDCFTIVKKFDGIKDLTKLKELEKPNKEGFVIRWDNGLRLKSKFETYVKLHAIVTGTSSLSVWRALKSGESLSSIQENVPDEFALWLNKTISSLKTQQQEWKDEALREFKKMPKNVDRKTFALAALKSPMKKALFSLLDNQSIDEMAWKEVRPEFQKPFTHDIDEG